MAGGGQEYVDEFRGGMFPARASGVIRHSGAALACAAFRLATATATEKTVRTADHGR